MTGVVIDVDTNDRIKDIRDTHSLKIQDISDITGYSVSSIKKWMIKKTEKSYTPAPIQALKLLTLWVDAASDRASQEQEQHLADVITFATGKGGVGKTTVAYNTALILSQNYRKKTLAVDLDVQGHLSGSLIPNARDMGMTASDLLLGKYCEPYKANENLDVIGIEKSFKDLVASIKPLDLLYRLQENIARYRKEYDYIIFDGIPTDSPWADSVLAATTKLVMPVTPDLYDVWGMQDVFNNVEMLKMRKVTDELKVACIVCNIVSSPMSTFDKTIIASLKENFPNHFCPTAISRSVKVKECKSPAVCKSIVEYEPNSSVAKQYLDVVDYILNS